MSRKRFAGMSYLSICLVYAIFHALKPPHARHRVTLYRVHLGEALLLISSER